MTRDEQQGQLAAVRGVLGSLRVNLVLWYVGLLAVALTVSVVAIHAVLTERLLTRIDGELAQEAEELRTLAQGRDPEDGEPFGARVDRVLETFLRRNIPGAFETFVGYVDGRPTVRSARTPALRLDTDPELNALWANVATTTRGQVSTDVGRVDYLAVPLQVGGSTRGVLVVASFTDLAREEIVAVVRLAAVVGALALLVTGALAAALAGRMLRPIRALTEAARTINDTDLSRRIAVQGSGELAELATVVNGMLERLETAFDAQRAFLDDTGHELRTPITIIRGHLELLGSDPAETQETVALLLDELDRMHRLVEDLIVLAKAERPDFLRLEPVDVAALTDEVLSKAQALDDRPWSLDRCARARIVADRQRLTQALVQLAHNAVEYTPPGTAVSIGSEVRGADVRLWVRDEGPGIPPAEREHIFDRFQRGVRGQRARDGTGLGLPIVRAVAEAHGGHVELDSAPGVGTTFTLVLPVDVPEPQRPDSPRRRPPSALHEHEEVTAP